MGVVIKPPRSLVQVLSQDSIRRYTELVSKTLSNISLGTTTSNTDPDKNIGAYKATGTTPGVVNTAFTVNHGLTHVPFGFSVLRTNAAAHIYDSGIAWTAATNAAQGTISLKCDQVTVAFTIAIW